MPAIAFIVEGACEQRAVQRLCPGTRVVTLGLNGKDASVPAIARRIAAISQRFSNRHYPIVVVFDRENRPLSREEIYDGLVEQLEQLDIEVDQFVIGIPDRKMENWMLPFVSAVFGQLADEEENIYREGMADIGRLQSMLRARGQVYHKTTTGTELICGIDPAILREKSSSFADFYTALEPFCRWGQN